jgi:hypothetical protein
MLKNGGEDAFPGEFFSKAGTEIQEGIDDGWIAA